MAHPMDITLAELAAAVEARRWSPVEVVRACLARISERNPRLNCVSHLCAERALREAEAQTAILAGGGQLGPLGGCPFLVKDLEDVEGLPTSYGCVLYKDNVAVEDSVQVARLRAAGGIVVGKANTALFGGNASCSNEAHGTTRNPWDRSRTPGGSSGGSAAAVAARLVPFATAADGGGSIRIPAALCGVFGIKCTFGLVPQDELRQFRQQHFVNCVHFGPVTRSVADACMYLDAVCGYHPQDPRSLPKPSGPPFAQLCRQPPPAGLRVGFSSSLGVCEVAEADALRHAHAALDVLQTALGAAVDRDFAVQLPDVGLAWVKLMGTQERLAVHERAREVAQSSGESLEKPLAQAWALLEGVTQVEDFGAAHKQLFELNDRLADAFRRTDILATLALPMDAFAAERQSPPQTLSHGAKFEQRWHPFFTMIPFNFSGHPACVLRSPLNGGRSERTGMPMALQLVAERHSDGLLLQVAAAYERAANAYATWPDMEASATAKL